MDPAGLKLQKVVIETRFNPSLLYEQKRMFILQPWTEKLPNVSQTPSTLNLASPERKMKVFCEWNRAGVDVEEVTNFANFRDESHNFLRSVLEGLIIKKINRIGVRHFFLYPWPENFESLNKLLVEQSVNEALNSSLPRRNVKDMALVLVYTDGDAQYRVATGPLSRKEFPDHFAFELTKEIETAILIDHDYYSTNWNEKHDIKGFIQTANKSADEWSKAYITFLK